MKGCRNINLIESSFIQLKETYDLFMVNRYGDRFDILTVVFFLQTTRNIVNKAYLLCYSKCYH